MKEMMATSRLGQFIHNKRQRSNSIQADSGIGHDSFSHNSSLNSDCSLEQIVESGRRNSINCGVPSTPASSSAGSRPVACVGRRVRSASLSQSIVGSDELHGTSAAILIRRDSIPIDSRNDALPLMKALSLQSDEDVKRKVSTESNELNMFVVEDSEQGFVRLLQAHSCFEIIPNASKVIVLDTQLPVKKAFYALIQNSTRAALLWESQTTKQQQKPIQQQPRQKEQALASRKLSTSTITDNQQQNQPTPIPSSLHSPPIESNNDNDNKEEQSPLILANDASGSLVGVLSITDFIRVLLRFHNLNPTPSPNDEPEESQFPMLTPPNSLPKDSCSEINKALKQQHGSGGSSSHKHSVEKNFDEHEISSWRRMLKLQGNLRSLVTITSQESLFRAAQLLVGSGVHRIPIIDPASGNALHILTFKSLLAFLWRVGKKLPKPDSLFKTPKELGIGVWGDDIYRINPDTPLLDCLQLLIDHGISGLPIVSAETGRVVDMYTRFDAIGIAAEKAFDRIADITVEDALHHRKDAQNFEGVIRVQESGSLYALIDRIVEANVHRVVVVDSDDHLRGLVSISDLVKHLVLRPEIQILSDDGNCFKFDSMNNSGGGCPSLLQESVAVPMEWTSVDEGMAVIHEDANELH